MLTVSHLNQFFLQMLIGVVEPNPNDHLGHQLRAYLDDESDSVLPRRQAESSRLVRITQNYPPRQSGSAGTSMLHSGNSSLAALTFDSNTTRTTSSVSSSIVIRDMEGQRQNILDWNGGPDDPLQIPPINSQPLFECPFNYLDCFLGFVDVNEWFCHSLQHFGRHGPPNFSKCGFCDAEFRAVTGMECWRERMAHVELHYYQPRCRLAHARPDFKMFEYLWNKHLIPVEVYKDLLGKSNNRANQAYLSSPCLSSPVTLTYDSRRDRRERHGRDRSRR